MNPKTVLALDDDLSICMTLKKIVEKKGMAFIFADNLAQGSFQLGQHRPDICIADYEFQFGRNISIITKILRQAKKVIILTSKDPSEILTKHPELSFAQIITKGSVGMEEVVEMAL